VFAAGGNAMLLQLTVAVRIAIPYLINVITVTLKCSLAEIEGREIGIAIGEQGVAHDEEPVELGVASGDEITFQGILAFKLCRLHIHLGRTYLYPDELPVEVKVIIEFLAWLKGCILYPTLS
jgi:uncharacterized ubiquitin-like protein YukD